MFVCPEPNLSRIFRLRRECQQHRESCILIHWPHMPRASGGIRAWIPPPETAITIAFESDYPKLHGPWSRCRGWSADCMNKQQLLAKREYFNMVHAVTLRTIGIFSDEELAQK